MPLSDFHSVGISGPSRLVTFQIFDRGVPGGLNASWVELYGGRNDGSNALQKSTQTKSLGAPTSSLLSFGPAQHHTPMMMIVIIMMIAS